MKVMKAMIPDEDEFNEQVSKRLYNALDPSADDYDKEKGMKAIEGLSEQEAIEILRENLKQKAKATDKAKGELKQDWVYDRKFSDRNQDKDSAFKLRRERLKDLYEQIESEAKKQKTQQNQGSGGGNLGDA